MLAYLHICRDIMLHTQAVADPNIHFGTDYSHIAVAVVATALVEADMMFVSALLGQLLLLMMHRSRAV